MRVTDKMIFDNAATSSGRAREQTEQAVSEVSSGMRVVHPWDDPGAAGLAVGHTMSAARFTAIGETVGRASDELGAADGALGQFNDLLTRANQLAIQMSNSSYSAADRGDAASQAQSMVSQAVALLNTRFGDRYLFGGNKDDQPPFDPAGNYVGDDAVRQVEIAPGELEDASVRADVIAKGVGGGVDILTALQSFSTALSTNDLPTIQGTITSVTSAISQVSAGRSRLGEAMNLFDTAAETSRIAVAAEQTSTSKLVEIDAIESATRLAFAQRGLDAALTASARSFDLTLLSKLQ